LAARRQARAEAREIRMRELERQQKESEQTTDNMYPLSPAEIKQQKLGKNLKKVVKLVLKSFWLQTLLFGRGSPSTVQGHSWPLHPPIINPAEDLLKTQWKMVLV